MEKILDLRCIPEKERDYVRAILQTERKPMKQQTLLDSIFQDIKVDPDFRARVMVSVLNCQLNKPLN